MLRILFLCSLFFLLSCSEDSGAGSGNGNIELGTFRVDIDGTRWEANNSFVISTISSSILSIAGSKFLLTGESEAIAISIGYPSGNISELKGSYVLDGTGGAALSFVTTNSQEVISYLSVDGQVTINAISETQVSGIFTATCVNTADQMDTITMTNGAFATLITSSP